MHDDLSAENTSQHPRQGYDGGSSVEMTQTLDRHLKEYVRSSADPHPSGGVEVLPPMWFHAQSLRTFPRLQERADLWVPQNTGMLAILFKLKTEWHYDHCALTSTMDFGVVSGLNKFQATSKPG